MRYFQKNRLEYSCKQTISSISRNWGVGITSVIQTIIYFTLIWHFAGIKELSTQMRWFLYSILAIFTTLLLTFLRHYIFTYPRYLLLSALDREERLQQQINGLQEQVNHLTLTETKLVYDKDDMHCCEPLHETQKKITEKCVRYRLGIVNTSSKTISAQITMHDIWEQTQASTKLYPVKAIISASPIRLHNIQKEETFVLYPSSGTTKAQYIELFDWKPKKLEMQICHSRVPSLFLKLKESYMFELFMRGEHIPESSYRLWVDVGDKGHLTANLYRWD